MVIGFTVEPSDGKAAKYCWQDGFMAMLRSSIAISPRYPLPRTPKQNNMKTCQRCSVNYYFKADTLRRKKEKDESKVV